MFIWKGLARNIIGGQQVRHFPSYPRGSGGYFLGEAEDRVKVPSPGNLEVGKRGTTMKELGVSLFKVYPASRDLPGLPAGRNNNSTIHPDKPPHRPRYILAIHSG